MHQLPINALRRRFDITIWSIEAKQYFSSSIPLWLLDILNVVPVFVCVCVFFALAYMMLLHAQHSKLSNTSHEERKKERKKQIYSELISEIVCVCLRPLKEQKETAQRQKSMKQIKTKLRL